MSSYSMRLYTISMLSFTVFLLFADQNLLAPNLSAAAKDFGFNDQERDEKLGGYIAIGFFIIGGAVAVVVGYFTDIVNRATLFGVVVVFGEAACLGTYFVRTYAELFACRVLTGVSIGGATPIIFSMLGDLYPQTSRIYVSAMIGIFQSAGIAFGQFLAGMVGPKSGWRTPFIIIALPAMLCGITVFFTVHEPSRGTSERAFRTVMEKIRKDKAIGSTMVASCVPNKSPDTSILVLSHPQSLSKQQANRSLIDACDEYEEEEEAQGRNEEVKEYDCGEMKGNENPPVLPSSDSLEEELDCPSSDSLVSEHAPPFGKLSVDVNKRISTTSEIITGADDDNQLHYSERIAWSKLGHLFCTPSVLIIFIQGFPGCLPWGMIYTFLNDYLSEDRGMTVQAATGVLTLFGIGGLLGQLSGGYFGQYLYNVDVRYVCLLMGISTMFSIFPVLFLLNAHPMASSDMLGACYFLAFLGGWVVNMNGPNVRVLLQNVVMPEVRGTAFALFSLADDLGKGFGPFLVVLVIQGFHGNRQAAFNAVVYFWLFCGILLLCLVATVQKDEETVQQKVAQALYQHNSMLGHHINTSDGTKADPPRTRTASLELEEGTDNDHRISSAVMKTNLLSHQYSSSSSSSSPPSWWARTMARKNQWWQSNSVLPTSTPATENIDMNNQHNNHHNNNVF